MIDPRLPTVDKFRPRPLSLLTQCLPLFLQAPSSDSPHPSCPSPDTGRFLHALGPSLANHSLCLASETPRVRPGLVCHCRPSPRQDAICTSSAYLGCGLQPKCGPKSSGQVFPAVHQRLARGRQPVEHTMGVQVSCRLNTSPKQHPRCRPRVEGVGEAQFSPGCQP